MFSLNLVAEELNLHPVTKKKIASSEVLLSHLTGVLCLVFGLTLMEAALGSINISINKTIVI